MNCFKSNKDNVEIRPNVHNDKNISSSNIIEKSQISSQETKISQIFNDSGMNLLGSNNSNTSVQNINNNGDEQSENQELIGDNFILEEKTSDNILFGNYNDTMKPE